MGVPLPTAAVADHLGAGRKVKKYVWCFAVAAPEGTCVEPCLSLLKLYGGGNPRSFSGGREEKKKGRDILGLS